MPPIPTAVPAFAFVNETPKSHAVVLLAWLVPFSIMPEVTPGMLLNALALNLLILLAILATIGEYVIRNFTTLQRHPASIEREVRSRPTPADGGASPAHADPEVGA